MPGRHLFSVRNEKAILLDKARPGDYLESAVGVHFHISSPDDRCRSTWQSAAAWNAWKMSPERAEIQEQIDAMLSEPTEYEVYENL
jgi:hypothetical protein